MELAFFEFLYQIALSGDDPVDLLKLFEEDVATDFRPKANPVTGNAFHGEGDAHLKPPYIIFEQTWVSIVGPAVHFGCLCMFHRPDAMHQAGHAGENVDVPVKHERTDGKPAGEVSPDQQALYAGIGTSLIIDYICIVQRGVVGQSYGG